MRKLKATCGVTVLSLLMVALLNGTVLSQAAPAGKDKLAEHWDNFLHFILIANPVEARSNGEAILDARPDPKRLYKLSLSMKTGRGPGVLARGRTLDKELAKIIIKIEAMIDAGAKAVRKDPTEIARWIKLLGGMPQHFLIGTERLITSSEYAIPQIISKLSDVNTPAILRERLVTILPRLGKEAVRPLVAALATEDPSVREIICRTLGKIGYPHAAPHLKVIIEQKDQMDSTRNAARVALSACAGKDSLNKSAAELFYQLSLKYYNRNESVNPDSRYDTANVWFWRGRSGLTYKIVPRVIFNDIYAMRSARMALALNPGLESAVTIWIAADIRKEINLPKGAADPTRSVDEPGAKFAALASGAKYLQCVLAKALADGDVRVALAVIESLARTAGAKNLVVSSVEGHDQPLVKAMSYPSRRVRYTAAEVLALARPTERFSGWHLVAPVLTEALRGTGKPAAIFADPKQGRRNIVKDLLRGGGCSVIDDAAFGKALQSARAEGGADLVVLASNITAPNMVQAITLLRAEAVFSRTPVIIIAGPNDVAGARILAKKDQLIVVVPDSSLDAASINAAIKDASAKASGAAPLSEDEAVEWSIRAAGCFRLLAMTQNLTYDLTGAVKSLIAALGDKRNSVRIAAAEALAQFPAARAQRAVARLAVDAEADEKVRVAAYAALSESVRRFGNQLEKKQFMAIVDDVMSKGSLKIRDAAAQALGALALKSENIQKIIQTLGRDKV